MVRSDKNGFLTSIKIPEKLELTEIRKDLPQFVRNRKNAPKIPNEFGMKQNNDSINNSIFSKEK